MLRLVSYPLHLPSCSTGWYTWYPLLSLESPTSSDKPSHPVAGVGLSVAIDFLQRTRPNLSGFSYQLHLLITLSMPLRTWLLNTLRLRM